MSKTVLFSPVGGTDPISLTNYYDGSLLHITRVYQPDEIIMYMSREVLDIQKEDDRYRYALNRLFEFQKRKPAKIREIERGSLNAVQDFDFFYEEFRQIINEELKQLGDSDRLLINISSGTPAMKSGLLVLQTLSDFPAVLIQVDTPVRGMNEHYHKGYENEIIWGLNNDNDPELYVNRCREVKCPSLTKLKKEEIIRQQVLDYDYKAALTIAEGMPTDQTSKYIDLIRMGYHRSLFDHNSVNQLIKTTGYNCFPVKEEKSREDFEYTLNLDIKVKRGLYSDFILGISPIIVSMFERILKNQANVDLKRYTAPGKNGVRKWERSALSGTQVEDILLKTVGADYCYNKPVYSSAMIELIKELCKDSNIVSICQGLRDVEANIRNRGAHQIASITDKTIKKETGYSAEEIIKNLKKLFSFAGIVIPKNAWASYALLNEEVIRRMQ